MSYIASIGLGIPNHVLTQEDVKDLIPTLFPTYIPKLKRVLPIFDHSNIEKRQVVVEKEWFTSQHSFQERNNLYINRTVQLATQSIQECLHNEHMLKEKFLEENIDLLVFVSSTGISTPSIDAHIINELNFRQDVVRMPLWGLGCAGGAMALSRAHEWLEVFPSKNALIVSSELCSLTFQKDDQKMSNLVGTALFGDGVSAALLIGNKSPQQKIIQKRLPKLLQSHSLIKKNTLGIMGWEVTNHGFEVVFSKRIPRLIQSIWKPHVEHVLTMMDIHKDSITSWIVHPGGRKVIEEMMGVFQLTQQSIRHSIDVLREHGNMSSTTIFYILKRWLEGKSDEKYSVISSLGPGFSSEVLLAVWEDAK